jgi:CRP-like cAMP-binding protein
MQISAPVPRDFAGCPHLWELFRSRLDGAARAELVERLSRAARTVPAGAEILHEGGPAGAAVWVLDGWVALSKSLEDGRSQTVDLVLPGDLIPARPGARAVSPVAATALTSARLATLPKGSASAAPLPALAELIEELAAGAAARQWERMLRLGQSNAVERVAFLLIELHVRLGQAGGRGRARDHLPMPITQGALGAVAGTSHETVCRTLARLEADGLVARRGPSIRLLDLSALEALAQVSAERLSAGILPASDADRARLPLAS